MNAYSNRNIPPARGGMAVGQRVHTLYGCGIIMDIKGTFHRGSGANLDPILAVILILGNPPRVINQPFSNFVFTDGAVGGQMSTKNGLIQ